MDNYLEPSHQDEHIMGETKHLPFELITFGISPRGEWDIVSTQAFFSLKLAMATLLTQDMKALYDTAVPDGADAPTTLMSMRIKGRPDYFGAIVISHAARPDHVLDPGVYFSTRRGTDEMERVAGIPFVATVGDADIDLFPLSLPGAGGELNPTAHLLHLSRWAQQWIEAQSAVIYQMDHQLVIKGVYPTSPQQYDYVLHHHFNNAADALMALLAEDVRNFDRFSANRNYYHTHAYLTDSNGAVNASIFTVPIGSGQQGTTAAGVYLLAQPHLGALVASTGVPLAAASQYDPKAQNLQLATLHYVSEFAIQPTEGLRQIRTEIARADQEAPRFDSTFSVHCHYQLATEGESNRVLDAMDQLHYRSPESAIYSLLHQDLELWSLHHSDPGFVMQLRAAMVQSGDQTLARIQVSTLPPLNGVSDLQLHLSDALHGSMAEVYSGIGNYVLSTGAGEVNDQGITLNIGSVIEGYGTQLHRNVTSDLVEILQQSFWIQRQYPSSSVQVPQTAQTAERAQEATAPDNTGYVLLEWSGATAGQNDDGRQLWTRDLEEAHRFIQDLPAAFFRPPAHDNSAPCLRSARLFDAALRTAIITRTYHPFDTPGMAAGFYYSYNMQHPLGALLASYHPRSAMAEGMSSADTHIFYQGSAVPAALPQHHSRQLSADQPVDGRRISR